MTPPDQDQTPHQVFDSNNHPTIISTASSSSQVTNSISPSPPPKTTKPFVHRFIVPAILTLLSVITGIYTNRVQDPIFSRRNLPVFIRLFIIIALIAIISALEVYQDSNLQNWLREKRKNLLSWLEKSFHHHRILKIGAIVGAAIILLVIGVFQSLSILPHCATEKICIVIAPIDSIDKNVAYNTPYNIQNAIQEALSRFDESEKISIDILPIEKVVKKDEASDIAYQTGASLFVWGELLDNEEIRLYLNSDEKLRIDHPSVIRSFRIQPIYYYKVHLYSQCVVDICIRLKKSTNSESYQEKRRLHAAVYAAIGLAYYTQENFRQSANFFQYALYCMEQPVSVDFLTKAQSKTLCRKDSPSPRSNNASESATHSLIEHLAYEEYLDQFYQDCKNNNFHLLPQPNDSWDVPLLYLLYYFNGKSLALLGDYSKGIHQLAQATSFVPQEPATMISIAYAYLEWIKPPKPEIPQLISNSHIRDPLTCAEALLQNFLKGQASQDEKHLIYYELGIIDELEHDWDNAGKNYQTAYQDYLKTSSDLDPYVTLMALARIEKEAHKLDDAIKHLELAENLVKSFDVLHELADLYQEKAKIAGQNSNTQNEQSYNNKARAYLHQAQQLVPTEVHKLIIQSEFCDSTAENSQCTCPISPTTQFDEAWPNASWLASKMGDCFKQAKNWEKAEEYFEKSEMLSSQDPWVHERFAYTLMQLGKYQEALLHYQHAIDFSHPEYIPHRFYTQRIQALCNVHLAKGAWQTDEICDSVYVIKSTR